jgi:hypothetical protein
MSVSVILFAAISSGVGATNGMDLRWAARTLVLYELYIPYPIIAPSKDIRKEKCGPKKDKYTRSVPCKAYVGYPRTSVINVLKIRAVSLVLQFCGGGEEKRKPGREGTITLNDIRLPLGLLHNCVSGLITGRNSWKEPEKKSGNDGDRKPENNYQAIRASAGEESDLIPQTLHVQSGRSGLQSWL